MDFTERNFTGFSATNTVIKIHAGEATEHSRRQEEACAREQEWNTLVLFLTVIHSSRGRSSTQDSERHCDSYTAGHSHRPAAHSLSYRLRSLLKIENLSPLRDITADSLSSLRKCIPLTDFSKALAEPQWVLLGFPKQQALQIQLFLTQTCWL